MDLRNYLSLLGTAVHNDELVPGEIVILFPYRGGAAHADAIIGIVAKSGDRLHQVEREGGQDILIDINDDVRTLNQLHTFKAGSGARELRLAAWAALHDAMEQAKIPVSRYSVLHVYADIIDAFETLPETRRADLLLGVRGGYLISAAAAPDYRELPAESQLHSAMLIRKGLD